MISILKGGSGELPWPGAEDCTRSRRYLLIQAGSSCPYKVGVEQVRSSIFMSEGLYLSDLSYIDDTIQLSFHFPLRYAPVDRQYEIRVEQRHTNGIKLFDKKFELNKPTLSIANYAADQSCVWIINLERELAFQGRLKHAPSEIFG
jgi:hypothetical protein